MAKREIDQETFSRRTFPLDAFEMDDPDTVVEPALTLIPPWKLSAKVGNANSGILNMLDSGAVTLISAESWVAGATIHTIDCSAYVPADATAALFKFYGASGGTFIVRLYRDADCTILDDIYHNYTGAYVGCAMTACLDTAKACYARLYTSNITIYVSLVAFYKNITG